MREVPLKVNVSSVAVFTTLVCQLFKSFDELLTFVYSPELSMMFSKSGWSNRIWRVHNALLVAGERGTMNKSVLLRISASLCLDTKFVQQHLTAKELVVEASLPFGIMSIVYAACSNQTDIFMSLRRD